MGNKEVNGKESRTENLHIRRLQLDTELIQLDRIHLELEKEERKAGI